MKHFMILLFAAAFFGGMSMSGVRAASLDNDTRVALNVELREYIGAKTNGGLYSYFNEKTGKIEMLRLKRIHPVIFGKQGRFMMCADFIDKKGKDVILDYIVLPISGGHLIEKEIKGKRSMLTKIFEKLM